MKENFFEIILITYNRKPYLENTLKEILAENSPVKNFPFTVLDNCCTDGSSELLQDYARRLPNLKHIRHAKNIGGGGNIARALETAKATYAWIICDDDSYNWAAWPEIAAVMETEEYDIILTRKDDLKGGEDIAKIMRQLTFLPAAIYKTSNITGGVLQNALTNIPNWFPHLALGCEVLNKKGKFYICKQEMLGQDISRNVTPWGKPTDNVKPHPFAANIFWTVGYLNSLRMINDKKLRTHVIDNIGKHGFLSSIYRRFYPNKTRYKSNALNVYYVLCAVNFRQKIEFCIALILMDIVYFFQSTAGLFRNKKG